MNMRNRTYNIRKIEFFVFIVVWIGVFAIPYYSHRYFDIINWSKVIGEWIRMFSFLVIFLLNIFFLVPKYLFKKKYSIYIGFTFITILAVIGVTIALRYVIGPQQPLGMPKMDLGPGMPPMELGPGMPPPMGYKPVDIPVERPLFMIFLDNFIVAILVVGVGTAVEIISQWLNEENWRKDLEKEQLKTELALLRHQVSPHFFMNTLNNIHALIDIN